MPLLTEDIDLASLLRSARSIAIVGLSDKPYRESHVIARYLLNQGYTIYPVNPLIDSVLGLPSHKDLKSLRDPVDIVDVFRNTDFVPTMVEDAITAKMKTLWFQLGVANPKGTAMALQAGMQIVEDRCIMVEHQRLLR